MADSTIYRRTAEGQTAAREHSAALDVRERTLLGQIDGKRRVSDIKIRMAVLMDVDAVLAALVRRNMIELDPAHAPAPPVAPASPAAATQAPAAGGSTATMDVPTLRRTLIRAVHDALGPEGEQVEMRLENAKTLEALREVAERAAGVIEALRGRAASQKFRALLE